MNSRSSQSRPTNDSSPHSPDLSQNSVHETGQMSEQQCPIHHLSVITYTSYTEDNPGRRFQRCPRWENGKCKFFEWVEDDIPSPYKVCASRVARKKNNVEYMLKQSREKEYILTQQLEVLQQRVNMLENQLLNMELMSVDVAIGLCRPIRRHGTNSGKICSWKAYIALIVILGVVLPLVYAMFF